MWCIPRLDGEYVARMENVLDLYAEAPILAGRWSTATRAPVQLIGRVRQPMPAEPGQFERYDCEVPPQRHRQSLRLRRRAFGCSLGKRLFEGRIHRPSLGFTARTADRHPQRRKGPATSSAPSLHRHLCCDSSASSGGRLLYPQSQCEHKQPRHAQLLLIVD
jgi:hypothetical protein